MKFLDILKTANQNLLRNKVRTFLTILAIFIGSFTIILNSGISTGVNVFIDQQVANYGGEGYMMITPDSLASSIDTAMTSSGAQEYSEDKSQEISYIEPEELEKVRKIEGVKSVDEMKTLSVEYIKSDKNDKRFKLPSVRPLASDTIKIDMEAGRNIEKDGKDLELVLPPDYAESLGFSSSEAAVGQTIELAVVNYMKQQMGVPTKDNVTMIKAKIVGVQAPGVISMDAAWVNTALSDKIYNTYMDKVPATVKDRIYTATADVEPDKIESVKAELKKIGLSGMSVNDIVGSIKSFFDVILVVFTIFGVIALIAAAIGIINTLFMSVQERTREIGLNKALGMSSGKIFLSFSLEAIMLGFWGSVVGIIIAMLVGNAANAIFHQAGGFLEAFPTLNIAGFYPSNIIPIVLIIMFIAFLAGTIPASKASHKDPIDALRYE